MLNVRNSVTKGHLKNKSDNKKVPMSNRVNYRLGS